MLTIVGQHMQMLDRLIRIKTGKYNFRGVLS